MCHRCLFCDVLGVVVYWLGHLTDFSAIKYFNRWQSITVDILLNLYNHHYNMIFCWIPSHVGIKGNTKADKLAHVTPISSTQVIPIPPSDALSTLWNYIRTKWQATWDSFPPNNKQRYKISPKLQHFPPLHQSYSRKEHAIINRLLIGDTHLTHSYLLNKEQPPNSNYCKSLLTVEHILTSCSAYKNIREKHYSNSQLPHILTNISKQHIFN